MDLKDIDDQFAVSAQLQPSDMQSVADAGFRTVICNRPDNEEPGQPSARAVREAALQAGLVFHFVPISGHDFTDEAVQTFAELRRSAAGPVLAYCRSGTRSLMLETLANPTGRSIEDRLSRAAAAGYDLSSIRARLSEK